MNKAILLALLCIMISAKHDLRAQTPFSDNRSAIEIWLDYQSLLPKAQSSKTTNTYKRVKAYSYRTIGKNYVDSLRVLVPSPVGYSTLNYKYFRPEYLDGHGNTYDNLASIVTYGHVDFFKALFFYHDSLLTHPDTLEKTISPMGKILSFREKAYDNTNSQYYDLEKANYQYDSQERLVKREIESIADQGLTEFDYQYYYSPLDDYINISILYQSDTTKLYYEDSLVLNSGKLIASYTVDTNGNLINSHNLFYYNSNQELIKSERYEGSNLTDVFETFRRPNSDFPDSFRNTHYSGSNIVIETGHYSYNASTGFLESFVQSYSHNGMVYREWISFISTDADGDITEAKVYDSRRNDTISVVKLYYEDNADAINSNVLFDSDIQAYPVPSSQEVKITSSEEFNGFALYDASGRVLESRTFTKTRESLVDLSAYSPGIYFLEIMSGDKKQRLKIERI